MCIPALRFRNAGVMIFSISFKCITNLSFYVFDNHVCKRQVPAMRESSHRSLAVCIVPVRPMSFLRLSPSAYIRSFSFRSPCPFARVRDAPFSYGTIIRSRSLQNHLGLYPIGRVIQLSTFAGTTSFGFGQKENRAANQKPLKLRASTYCPAIWRHDQNVSF